MFDILTLVLTIVNNRIVNVLGYADKGTARNFTEGFWQDYGAHQYNAYSYHKRLATLAQPPHGAEQVKNQAYGVNGKFAYVRDLSSISPRHGYSPVWQLFCLSKFWLLIARFSL